MKTFSLISWNVNGVRAAERKGFIDFLNRGQWDLVAIQETKVSDENILSPGLLHPDHYNSYWQGAGEKKGYSGVAIFTQNLPLKIKTDFGQQSLLSKEGRVIELHFSDFILLNVYFPNGGASPDRLNYKLKFYGEFLDYLQVLKRQSKNIIFCGDVNTAHREIDLARPKENINCSGFMPIERQWLDRFEAAGFVDTFRHLHPEKVQYSWWDMKTHARERKVGWRIDYFYSSRELLPKVVEASILDEVMGSDHAPVKLVLKF